jgi:hypothetical protein
MEFEIFEVLTQILCPGNAIGSCQNFISSHSDAPYGVMGQLFYFLVIPTVFLILLIFFLIGTLPKLAPHPGVRILVSVVIFIYIIISGWYPILLFLGDMWFFATITIGALYFFLKKVEGGGGGMGKSRVFTGLGNVLWKQVSGQIPDLVKRIHSNLDSMEAMHNKMMHSAKFDIDNVYQAFINLMGLTENNLHQLREMESVGGLKVGHDYDRLLKRFNDICDKMNSEHRKMNKAA